MDLSSLQHVAHFCRVLTFQKSLSKRHFLFYSALEPTEKHNIYMMIFVTSAYSLEIFTLRIPSDSLK